MNDDLISRQAVLEQTYLWSKDEFLRVTNPFDYLRKRINDIPSVIPTDSVIEDIKVDIEKEKELYNTDVSVNYIDYGIKIGLNMALNIISKHIGGDADE